MPSTIITKNGSGAPLAADLVAGELAVDLTNGRLYTENSGGSVIEIGLNPSGNVDVTGTVTADGLTVTAAIPSIQMTDSDNNADAFIQATDGNMRFYADDNNEAASSIITFNIDGGEKVRITDTGNVGIGTVSPSAALDVLGSNSDQLRLRTAETEEYRIGRNVSTGLLDFYGSQTGFTGYTFGGIDGERVRIDASGNVGINATTVAANGLQIGNTSSTDTEQLYLYSNKATFSLEADGANNAAGTIMTYSWASGGQGSLRFKNASGEVARLDANGNLLVGRTSRLVNQVESISSDTVVSAHGVLSSHQTNAAIMQYTSNQMLLRSYGATAGTGQIVFQTGGGGGSPDSEAMRIDASGSLLVGTASAISGNKHCFVDSTIDTTVIIQKSSSDASYLPLAVWHTATSGNNLFVKFFTEGSATERGNIDYNRTGNQVRYNVTSDQRLKENIVDASSASDDIDAIKVRQFDWVENGYHQSYGLIAQELLTVVPDAVSSPEDPEEMMGVDYSKLVPMMLKEIQQLRARVAQLEGAN